MDNFVIWLPIDGVADRFDRGVAGGHKYKVGEFRHVGRVVYDLNAGKTLRQPSAMFGATRRDCDDASAGEGRCGEGRAYPARADDADIAMVFGQFPMWGLSLRAGATGGIFCDN